MSLSRLCQRCGLCCDGSLFSHVPLQPEEAGPARRHGLDVEELVGGAPALRQCCTALKNRQCTLYAQRPERCRAYGCRLYHALASGQVSVDEAFSVVDQAHALLAALDESLPPDTDVRPSPVMERARFADLSEHGLSPETRALRERTEALLDAHFHGGPRHFGEGSGEP
ncbi:YkgJ family cysteine cluster protein [Vitiosangium sp. GDMCC 1.1324]|uniref:YkgJ family cysteine cluster protein n=1 Tax=Vitiosangium sp. (strain GDMCC 1.1324) TaxID=2138576 RepID=UPI000D372E63|nr:YkgJ family cysteine cluster protein [Vitiosangium sp. GDMCC 1.1324]PTL77041.1 zinc/iron-chelating domain-containing protein [Vitiosangium sp. GDMCC 1.1324]